VKDKVIKRTEDASPATGRLAESGKRIMGDKGLDYWMRRAREEQVAASRALDPRAAASHAGLAREYESALSRAAGKTPQGSRG
jgi:hypothetical protein